MEFSKSQGYWESSMQQMDSMRLMYSQMRGRSYKVIRESMTDWMMDQRLSWAKNEGLDYMIVWMIQFRFLSTPAYPIYACNNYFIGSFNKFIEWLTTATISIHFFLILYEDISLAPYALYPKKANIISLSPFSISSSEYW